MLPLALFFFQVTEHQAALLAYKQHQLAAAVEHFTQALKTEQPGSADYQESVLLLGQSLFLEGKFAESIPWLQKSTAGEKPLAEAAYMLGNACLFARKHDEAVNAFGKLFQVPANSAAAHLFTARMMLQHDMDPDAVDQAKAALAIDPKIPEAHFLLGEIAIVKADIDGAVAELTQEIALNPAYAMAHYRLGDAYTRLEDWDKAVAPLERSIWLNPNYSGPFILLGKSYLKRKEYANADGILRHALQLDPQNSSAHYLLGQTLMGEGKTDAAQKEMDKWKELQAGK